MKDVNTDPPLGLFVTFSPAQLSAHGKTGEKSPVSYSFFFDSHSSRRFRHSSNDLATVEKSSPSVCR